MQVVGVVGFIGSGKGTVGDILNEEYGYEKVSFGGKLKDTVAAMFGWDRAMLEGDTVESRQQREIVDEYWSNKFKRDISPRIMLQYVGTEVVRNSLHANYWVDALEKSLQINKKYVITDVRFQNEMDMIKSINGKIIRVSRGPIPDWYDLAKTINARNPRFWKPNKTPPVHESEWKWIRDDNYYDVSIDNNGSLEDLKEKLKTIGL